MLLSKPSLPIEPSPGFAEHFWAALVEGGGGCRVWVLDQGCDGNYGRVWVPENGLRRAHRVAWTLAYGPIPDGLFVCHHCDNPPCCRPEHLFLGDQADNIADAQRKQRLVRPPDATGEANPAAILTADGARQIRFLIDGGWERADVAACFGVSKACVQDIFKRRSWTHGLPGHAPF